MAEIEQGQDRLRADLDVRARRFGHIFGNMLFL